MNPLYVRQLGIQLAATGLAAGVAWVMVAVLVHDATGVDRSVAPS